MNLLLVVKNTNTKRICGLPGGAPNQPEREDRPKTSGLVSHKLFLVVLFGKHGRILSNSLRRFLRSISSSMFLLNPRETLLHHSRQVSSCAASWTNYVIRFAVEFGYEITMAMVKMDGRFSRMRKLTPEYP